jgi:hypothetical protein
MLFRGNIVLLFTFALVFARANVFAQGSFPISAVTLNASTPVPISELDPILVERGIDSIRGVYHLSRVETRLTIDTPVKRLRDYCNSRVLSGAKATAVITGISALQELACPQCEVIPNHETRVDVYATGVLTFDETNRPSVPFTFHVIEVYKQPLFDAMRPVEKVESSFWESTAQPIIVGIGAAVIVALFFLIRS